MGVNYLDGIGQNHSNTMSYCTRITRVSGDLCVVTADQLAWFTPWWPCGPSGRRHGCCSQTHCRTWLRNKRKESVRVCQSRYLDLKPIHDKGVPCDQLDKVVVEGDASTSIKDGGAAVTVEVCGDDLQKSEREVSEKTDRQTVLRSWRRDKRIPGALCIPGCPSWVLQPQP